MAEGTEHGIETVIGSLFLVLGLFLLLRLYGAVGGQMRLWGQTGAGLVTETQRGVLVWKP